MTRLTKKDFSNIITSAESVQLTAVLNHLDVEMLEADNNADIFTIIDAHLDARLNHVLNAVPDFTAKGRTYRARSKDLVSSENTYLTYQNNSAETYNQYRTADGFILNVLEWYDKWDEVTHRKIMIYAVKSSKAA